MSQSKKDQLKQAKTDATFTSNIGSKIAGLGKLPTTSTKAPSGTTSVTPPSSLKERWDGLSTTSKVVVVGLVALVGWKAYKHFRR